MCGVEGNKKKSTTRKNKKIKFASFCKTMHPINVKTLKRLTDYLTGLLSFSSFNISVFILSFGENLFFCFFSFCFCCWLCWKSRAGKEKRRNTFIRVRDLLHHDSARVGLSCNFAITESRLGSIQP